MNWWWFDPAKAEALKERRQQEEPVAELERESRPGFGTTIAVIAGLLLAGFFVFRRTMQRPQA